MNKLGVLSILMVCLFFTGCAAIDKIVPVNPETGYREATQITEDAAAAIPYGSGALAALLFISNTLIFVKKKKSDAGLMATIRAIEAAAKDPEMAAMVVKLKGQLSEAHKQVNVQPLINRLLSRVKFG